MSVESTIRDDPLRDLDDPHLPFEFVQDTETLEEVLPYLLDAPLIGVDTESNSFYSYRERVCLLQISTEEIDLVIDPLRGLPLERLAPMFASPEQVKIFHDAEFDVGLLKADYGFEMRSIFDTRVALSLMGCERPGLANVVGEHLGAKIDKSQQRSDWCRRPLSAEQLFYARDDTRFLIDLYYDLRADLEQCGRLHIHDVQCRALEELPAREKVVDPGAWRRIKGWRELSPRGRRFLHDLHGWREQTAERENVAPFRVIVNGILLSMARRAAACGPRLEAVVASQGRRIRAEWHPSLAAALEASRLREPLEAPPRGPASEGGRRRLDERQRAAIERLKKWRTSSAEREGMNAAYLLRKDAIIELALRQPRTLDDLADVPGLDAWCVEAHGEELLAALEREPSP